AAEADRPDGAAEPRDAARRGANPARSDQLAAMAAQARGAAPHRALGFGPRRRIELWRCAAGAAAASGPGTNADRDPSADLWRFGPGGRLLVAARGRGRVVALRRRGCADRFRRHAHLALDRRLAELTFRQADQKAVTPCRRESPPSNVSRRPHLPASIRISLPGEVRR